MSLAQRAVTGCGGWIVNHLLFSNMTANITFELPSERTVPFVQKLKDSGFSPAIEGAPQLGGGGDVRGMLVLTFLHDDPDLKRDVPAFG